MPAHLDRPLVEEQVVAMQVDRHAERALGGGDAGHVIDVGVGEQDVPDRELPLAGERQQRGDLVARIDEDGLAGVRARHHEAVLEERPDRSRLDYDHAVILAILDDLMFTSKIKTAAAQLGVPITFARSSEPRWPRCGAQPPALVILDLNNPRTDPLGTVGDEGRPRAGRDPHRRLRLPRADRRHRGGAPGRRRRRPGAIGVHAAAARDSRESLGRTSVALA